MHVFGWKWGILFLNQNFFFKKNVLPFMLPFHVTLSLLHGNTNNCDLVASG